MPAPSEESALVAHLQRLLAARQHPKTICPSEAARAMSAAELDAAAARHWRDLMPAAREALFEMRRRGDVDILQRGELISPQTSLADIKGPIRARLRKAESGE